MNIRSSKGAAIDIACGKRVAVELAEGTDNVLEDSESGTQKAAMYFSGHPEFQGGGTLTVRGNSAHAISAKEYLQLKKSVGTINILGAVKDGIHCGKGKVTAWDEEMLLNENEFFLCNGGVVNIGNVGGDCIDAGDYGCMLIKGGQLNLSVTATDACGLKAVNTFIMEDGNINMDVSGNLSDGIYVSNFANTSWQPLYVPFSMSFEDWDGLGLEVARLNGFYEYDDDDNGTIDRSALEVLRVKDGRLLPNHPYLIRARQTGTKTIILDDATVHPNASNSIDCFTVETKYTFTGIFSTVTMAQLNQMGAYVMSGGSLRPSSGSLKPMRWYMLRESRGGQLLEPIKEIKIYVLDEEDADVIHEIAEDEQDNGSSPDAGYRNLMGQKVKKSARGIIIRNGKKYIK